MSSTSKARLIRSGLLSMRSLRDPTFQEDVNGGTAAWANDYFWGGYPRDPTEIPYSWLSPPARFRPDQARNVATITRSNGSSVRWSDRASVASSIGERPFTASIDSAVVDDPYNLATWIVDNYLQPRQRNPQLGLNLNARTSVECWRLLEREIGDRISITDAPGSDQQLVTNPWFETNTAGWLATGCTLSTSPVWSRSGSSSLLLTPDGVTANIFAEDTNRPVIAGASYTVDGWLFSPGGWPSVGISVNWYSGPTTYLSTSSSNAAIVAKVSERRRNTYVAPAGAVYARIHPVATGTPSGADVLYADEITLTGPDGNLRPWPAGVTELVIEGIANQISGDQRWLIWNTAPLIGAAAGQAGPWFRADESLVTGTDKLAW